MTRRRWPAIPFHTMLPGDNIHVPRPAEQTQRQLEKRINSVVASANIHAFRTWRDVQFYAEADGTGTGMRVWCDIRKP